jgi:hypothetical protein
MCAGNASDSCREAVRPEQLFTGEFVLVSRMGDFLRMDCLADVMKRGT